MKKILKYAVSLHDEFTLALPKDSVILKFDKQGPSNSQIAGDELMCLWVLIEGFNTVTEIVSFKLIPTGVEFDDSDLEYIDSILLMQGKLVFHLFKVRE